jgi:hypothetical protein
LYIVIGIEALVIAALGQLIYHLCKSFESIRVMRSQDQRGFEPLHVRPVAPLPMQPPDPPEYPRP